MRHPPRLSMRPGVSRTLLTWLLVLLSVCGCALPQGKSTQRPHAAATATPASPLAGSAIYWSQGDHLWALRASDGTTRWKVGGWSGPEPGCGNPCGSVFYSGPGNPVLADGVLYTLGYDAHAALNAYAIAASDGAIRWQAPILGCQIVFGEPPVVASGLVYLLTTGHQSSGFSCGTNTSWVYALRISDGAVQWKVPLDRSAFGSLALTDGVLVATASTEGDINLPSVNTLTGLRATDGKTLWHISGSYNSLIGEVANFVADGGSIAVTRTTRTADSTTGSVISSLSLYVLRASDGQTVWSRAVGHGSYFSSLAIASGYIFVHNTDGDMLASRATDGAEVWRYHTNAAGAGPLTMSEERLYFGAGQHLYVLDAASGAVIQSLPNLAPDAQTPNLRWSRPVVLPGVLAIGMAVPPRVPVATSFSLYALSTTTGAVLWTRSDLDRI